MSIIFFLICLFILGLCIDCFLSFIVFVVDVVKWHRQEKRIKVTGSAYKLPDEFKPEGGEEHGRNGDSNNYSGSSNNGDGNSNISCGNSSESSNDNGSSDTTCAEPNTESGERDAQSVFDSWMRS